MLSQEIKSLADSFEDYVVTGMEVTKEGMAFVVAQLREWERTAKAMEASRIAPAQQLNAHNAGPNVTPFRRRREPTLGRNSGGGDAA